MRWMYFGSRSSLRCYILPPALQGFREPRAGEYVFVPGRLHRWKRVDLLIKALQYVKKDIPLWIAGTGEDEASLRALAAGDRRIEFLGRSPMSNCLTCMLGRWSSHSSH